MFKKVLINCSETNLDLNIFDNDNTFIIGVERGCLDLMNKNIKIDLALSDFDNVLNEELSKIKKYANSIEKHNTEKDCLDGELAIIKAKELNAKANIVFIAKPTKRYDMNFSAINLVNKYGIKFINEDTLIQKLKSGDNIIDFQDFEHFTYISFFATQETIITIENMKYNVNTMKLKPFENSGISNALLIDKNPLITSSKDLIMIATK